MAQPATSTAAMTRQLSSRISVPVASLAHEARTTTASGTGVDLAGYEAACVVVWAGDWTDGEHEITVEDSDDDDTYEAVAAAHLAGDGLPTVSGEDGDDQFYLVDYVGRKRYIRAVQTVTGSPGTGLVSSAMVIKSHGRYTED